MVPVTLVTPLLVIGDRQSIVRRRYTGVLISQAYPQANICSSATQAIIHPSPPNVVNNNSFIRHRFGRISA
jgi:hypothetical protein